MKIKLVEVTKDDCGTWKGTWYKRGDLVFVTINPDYPKIYAEKYRAVDICGGINERDCREVRGLKAWLKCAWKTLTANVEFSGGAPLHGAASAGTKGYASGGGEE